VKILIAFRDSTADSCSDDLTQMSPHWLRVHGLDTDADSVRALVAIAAAKQPEFPEVVILCFQVMPL